MMRCIVTKYLGPTNSRGARLMAQCGVDSTVNPYDDGLDEIGNHRKATEKLARKLGYFGNWIGAPFLPYDKGRVFILYDPSMSELFTVESDTDLEDTIDKDKCPLCKLACGYAEIGVCQYYKACRELEDDENKE